MRVRVVLIIAIAGLAVLASCAAVADGPTPGITVNGTSEVRAKPDIAYITLGVSNEDKNAAKAAAANAETASAVIDAILKTGVAKSDIETVQFSISPVIDYRGTKPVTTGYQASNVIRVKTRNLAKIGGIIDTAIAAGANGVQGVRFDIEDNEKLRQAALVAAMSNAHADAELIASTLGVRLGKVTSVSESGPIIPRPMELGAMYKSAAETPIIPGEIEVSASVTVVYSIM